MYSKFAVLNKTGTLISNKYCGGLVLTDYYDVLFDFKKVGLH